MSVLGDDALDVARMEDAPAIASLLSRCLPDPWSATMVAESLAHGARGAVARTSGEVFGVVIVQVVAPEAEILQVAVAPERRGEGMGRRLLRTGLALAASAGALEAFLEVRPGNALALALYESEGFSQAGRRRAYYSDGEDALILRRTLAHPLG